MTRVEKAKKEHEAKKTAEAKAQEDKMVQMLTEALTLVKNTPYPTEVEEREKFFIDNLQKGEVLARQGIFMHVIGVTYINFIRCGSVD